VAASQSGSVSDRALGIDVDEQGLQAASSKRSGKIH
jgi:hypothetical protein